MEQELLEPPAGLKDKIMLKIRKEERFLAIRKNIFFSLLFATCISFLLPAVKMVSSDLIALAGESQRIFSAFYGFKIAGEMLLVFAGFIGVVVSFLFIAKTLLILYNRHIARKISFYYFKKIK